MLLRKINAIISLMTTLFLLTHAISTAVWMLSKGRIAQFASYAPWILAGLMIVHAFISIEFIVSGLMEGKSGKYKKYSRINRATIFQRVSGILLIAFAALHVAGAAGPLQLPQLVHTILPPLFFTVALAHAAVSTDKAFITLGIGNASVVKIVSIMTKAICAATLIASVVGFYLHVW